MEVYLVDGTYELFRAYHALPALRSPDGRAVGAVHGLVQSLLRLLREKEVTHIGCAFDSVITSFRNDLFPGYKTGEGTPPDLLAQFGLAERAAAALGLRVWPMVEFEADDAIAAATAQLGENLDWKIGHASGPSRFRQFGHPARHVFASAGFPARRGQPA